MKGGLNNDITISYLDNIKLGNGSKSTFVEDIEDVRLKAIGKTKDKSPCILAYNGVRGTYTPSNAFFVDIDTNYKVDEIINNRYKLFSKCPNIVFLQKSSSGNLHIVGTHGDVIESADEWNVATAYQTAFINESISQLFDINYVEYKNSKGQSSLDGHNTKWTQMFYVSDNTIYKNDCVNPVCICKKDRDILKEKYKDVFNFTIPKKNIQYITEKTNSRIEDYTYVGERICIDTELVEKEFPNQFKDNPNGQDWTGNDLRWRISIIAFNQFGDNAKEWCDERFYYDRGRSIYSIPSNTTNNPLVEYWLFSKGYLNKKQTKSICAEDNKHIIKINEDEWMSNYNKVIVDTIKNEKSISIKAPTGAGKTTALINIAKSCMGERTMLEEQFEKPEESLEDIVQTGEFREPLILVPYNVTNNLYKELNIVSSEIKDSKYKVNYANVMIWDQFIKYADDINPDVVFIDESHTLVCEQSYRDSAIATIAKLKEYQKKGIKLAFVSATPSFEIDTFNLFELNFDKKDKRNIKVEIVSIPEESWGVFDPNDDNYCTIPGLIKRDICCNKLYDRMCFFTNNYARRIFNDLISSDKDYSVALYHKEYPNYLNQLKETEILKDEINFFTCIAFNGLNIKNAGEKILVGFCFKEKENALHEIIQCLGRFRNNENIVLRLYIMNDDDKEDLDTIFHNAKVVCDVDSVEANSDYYSRMNDKKVQDALRDIENYMSKQTVDYIYEELGKLYPVAKLTAHKSYYVHKVDPEKRKQSALFVKKLVGLQVELDESNDYIKKWNEKLKSFNKVYTVDVESILIDKLYKDYFVKKDVKERENEKDVYLLDENGNKVKRVIITDKLISTIFDEIENILKVLSFTDEGWEKEKLKREDLKNNLKGNYRSRVEKKFKKNDMYRKKYAELKGDFSDKCDVAIDDYLMELMEEFLDVTKRKSEGGKKSKTNNVKKVKNTQTGQVFKSIKKAAQFYGKHTDTITNWLKSGKLIEI